MNYIFIDYYLNLSAHLENILVAALSKLLALEKQ